MEPHLPQASSASYRFGPRRQRKPAALSADTTASGEDVRQDGARRDGGLPGDGGLRRRWASQTVGWHVLSAANGYVGGTATSWGPSMTDSEGSTSPALAIRGGGQQGAGLLDAEGRKEPLQIREDAMPLAHSVPSSPIRYGFGAPASSLASSSSLRAFSFRFSSSIAFF
jgi:hypothetical protein